MIDLRRCMLLLGDISKYSLTADSFWWLHNVLTILLQTCNDHHQNQLRSWSNKKLICVSFSTAHIVSRWKSHFRKTGLCLLASQPKKNGHKTAGLLYTFYICVIKFYDIDITQLSMWDCFGFWLIATVFQLLFCLHYSLIFRIVPRCVI